MRLIERRRERVLIKDKENRHYQFLFKKRFQEDSEFDVDLWIEDNELKQFSRLIKLMYEQAKGSFTRNKVTFLDSKTKFQTIYEALQTAKRNVNIEYFIFHDDEAGGPAIKILKKKAEEGVTIKMSVDGLGTPNPLSRIKMKRSGIKYRTFYPVYRPTKYLLPKYIQHRMHRKILTIDGTLGFMGGLNFSNMYVDGIKPYPNWRDTHLCIEGDAVQDLQAIFLDDWEYITGEKIDPVIPSTYYPKCVKPDFSFDQDNRLTFVDVPMQIIPSGPDSPFRFAHHMLISAFSAAQKSIRISTPYFTPDPAILLALKTAALSGVSVQIIMQGKPENPPVKLAACGFHDELLECGVRIFEYWKGIFHAKTFVIDGRIAIVSSCNLDYRSFYTSYELSCIMYDQKVAQKLERDFSLDVMDCKEVTVETRKRRVWFKKAAEQLLARFAPYIKM